LAGQARFSSLVAAPSHGGLIRFSPGLYPQDPNCGGTSRLRSGALVGQLNQQSKPSSAMFSIEWLRTQPSGQKQPIFCVAGRCECFRGSPGTRRESAVASGAPPATVSLSTARPMADHCGLKILVIRNRLSTIYRAHGSVVVIAPIDQASISVVEVCCVLIVVPHIPGPSLIAIGGSVSSLSGMDLHVLAAA
jgi:hypothetical protein